MDRIRIFDTTLRDGEQTPGVSLTPDEKFKIAAQLDKLGVDVIEAGFPVVSKGEAEAIRRIAQAGFKAEICALARALKQDIDSAIDCYVDSVHVFISTSELHMRHMLKMTPEQVLQRAVESAEYAKAHGLLYEFSPMDATRTDPKFLKEVCKAVEEAGADRIDIPDTVGIATPKSMYEVVKSICEAVRIPVSVHCHNDLGLAVANSLAGVEAGATQVHVTVNGIGERAGNAALEEVVLALHLLYGKETGIDTSPIHETSRLVSTLTGIRVQPHKPITGDHAFAHEAGIHTYGITITPLTFEVIKPEFVGKARRIIVGKHAGRHGIEAELAELGLKPSKEELLEIVRRVKDLSDKGKAVTDTDLIAIAKAVMSQVPREKRMVGLLDLAVVTGIKALPTASVKLKVKGKEYVAAETGVGPVDAALKAIEKITRDLVRVRLREYRLEAITGGSDALAEVIIKVEDDKGRVVSARAAGEDIVMASVEAMMNAINRMLLKR